MRSEAACIRSLSPSWIDEELFGGEQLLEDVLVLLEDVLDQSVGLVEQARRGVGQPVAAEPFLVLEDRESRLGVAEELAEEPQLPDRQVSVVLSVVRLSSRIGSMMVVGHHAAGKEALHLAPVVLPGLQLPFSPLPHQFLVGALVGQGIGDRVAGIPRRKHPSAVFIRVPRTELLAVDELTGENEGLDELLHGLEIAELAHIGLGSRARYSSASPERQGIARGLSRTTARPELRGARPSRRARGDTCSSSKVPRSQSAMQLLDHGRR